MKQLKEMTSDELRKLKAQIENELESRSEEEKTEIVYTLSGKALKPASYKQVQLFEKLGGVIDCPTSQVTKRMEMSDMSEAIDLIKDGESVVIRYS
jgi:hypothetical protein